MPNNGQLLESWKNPANYGWPRMALRCQSSASVTVVGAGTVTYGHSAAAVTHWAPDALTKAEGMRLEVSSSFDGTSGVWSVSYYGPGAPFGGFHRSGAVYLSTVSIEVRPVGVLIYSKLTGSLLRILWTGLEVYVNDVLDTTLSGFDGVSNGVGPNYVPILAMPVILSGGGGSATHSAVPPVETCEGSDTGGGSGGGGAGGLGGGGEGPMVAEEPGTAEVVYSTEEREPVPEDSDVAPTDYDPAFSYDPCDPGDGLPIHYETKTEQTVSGGWRWYVDGAWEDLPVHVDVRNAPSLGNCANLDPAAAVTTSRTWGNHLSLLSWVMYKLEYLGREFPLRSFVDIICEHGTTRYWGPGDVECVADPCGETLMYRDKFKLTHKNESRSGTIRLQPNLEHILQRLGDDYAAELFRGHFPEVRGTASRSCTSRVGTGPCVAQNSTQSYVTHPDLSQFVGVVGQNDHPALDCLDYPFTAPVSVSASRLELVRVDYMAPSRVCVCPWPWFGGFPPNPCGEGYMGIVGVACGLEWPETDMGHWISETAGWVFPSYVGPYGGEYQWHLDDEARYLGSWCNPFWLLGYWTDPNDPPTWEVDGAPQSWPDYWGPVREQWFGDAFLPSGERTRQRNHLILSPAETEQGHTPFLDYAFGGLRWVGASRFKVLDVTIPTDITLSLTRPGVWAPRNQSGTDDCTVALGGGGITLSGFNVPEAWVELDLAQWTADPWLLLQLAKRVLVGWQSSNVDSIVVQLVGCDGAATTLGDTEGWYGMFPSTRLQTKYAGSWAIDNGALVVSDLGVDDGVAGISADVMADPERVLAFQLAFGGNYAKLRFKVTPTDTGLPVVLDWPQFELATGAPSMFWESGKTCALLWPNGPGVRWGQNTWYLPGLGFQDPPVPTGLGVTSTMVDALATAKRLLTGTGTASLATDITGDLGDYVDSYEGPASIAVVDKFGMGVPLPGTTSARLRFAMINSFAEVPPMSCWPTRKRAAPDWVPNVPNSPYWAGVLDWTQRTRYLVSGGAQVRLEDDDENSVGGPVASMPSGWFGWSYAPPLSNDEYAWRVLSGQLLLALLRPWHGFYVVVGGGAKIAPAVLETWEPRFVRATVDAGTANVIVEHAQFSTPPYMVETVVTDTGDCSQPCLAEDPRLSSSLVLLYTRVPSEESEDPQGVYERRSHDCAETWENEAMAFTGGRQPKVRSGDQALVRSAFIYNSGTSGPGKVHATFQGDGDDEPSDPFVWCDETGAELELDDTGYDFDHADDEAMRWVASFTVAGESSTSDWFSTDDCRTWRRVSP